MIPPASPGPDGVSVAEPGAWIEGDLWGPRYRRFGPLRYSDLGRRRLSPPADVEALAEWLAVAADGWWIARGEPDPFTLVVLSGDDGRLASAVVAAQPRCTAALRYVLVQPDHPDPAVPPTAMATALPLENPAFLYPAASTPDGRPDPDDDLERPPARGIGPMFTLLGDLPGLGDSGLASAVLAVEFLSRLPYDAYVVDEKGEWSEVRLAEQGSDLVEIAVPLESAPAGWQDGADPGRRIHWTGATAWLRQVLGGGATTTLAVVEAGFPPGLLDAAARAADPPAAIARTHLQFVEWRLS